MEPDGPVLQFLPGPEHRRARRPRRVFRQAGRRFVVFTPVDRSHSRHGPRHRLPGAILDRLPPKISRQAPSLVPRRIAGYSCPVSSPDPGAHASARRLLARTAHSPTPPPAAPPAGASKKQIRVADLSEDTGSLLEADGHTAVYDIVAHKVYMPDGRRLEAHSGFGDYLDDPRYVSERGRGPTPPNVYALSLREELFHGVRAIRLNPVGSGNMFGRDGMLAH